MTGAVRSQDALSTARRRTYFGAVGLVVSLLVAIIAATLITNAAVVADETGTSGLIDPVQLALFAAGGIGATVSFIVLVSNAIRWYNATPRSSQR